MYYPLNRNLSFVEKKHGEEGNFHLLAHLFPPLPPCDLTLYLCLWCLFIKCESRAISSAFLKRAVSSTCSISPNFHIPKFKFVSLTWINAHSQNSNQCSLYNNYIYSYRRFHIPFSYGLPQISKATEQIRTHLYSRTQSFYIITNQYFI